jgi:hypothetical protein
MPEELRGVVFILMMQDKDRTKQNPAQSKDAPTRLETPGMSNEVAMRSSILWDGIVAPGLVFGARACSCGEDVCLCARKSTRQLHPEVKPPGKFVIFSGCGIHAIAMLDTSSPVDGRGFICRQAAFDVCAHGADETS